MSECASTECADEEELGEYFTSEQSWQALSYQVKGDPDEEMQQELEQSSYVVCSNDESVSEDCEP
jgi:hypothetical protein